MPWWFATLEHYGFPRMEDNTFGQQVLELLFRGSRDITTRYPLLESINVRLPISCAIGAEGRIDRELGAESTVFLLNRCGRSLMREMAEVLLNIEGVLLRSRWNPIP